MSTERRLARLTAATLLPLALAACAAGKTKHGDGGAGGGAGGGKNDGAGGGGGGGGGGADVPPKDGPTDTPVDAPADTPVDTPVDAPMPDLPPPAMPCTAPADCTSGFCVDGYCCDMACAAPCRSCGLPATLGVCAVVKSVDDPDSCTGTMACSATGACVKKKGETCTASSECSTAFCTDGACCDTACTTPCMTCKTGTCTAVTTGEDAPECAMGSTCDATGKCKKGAAMSCLAAADCASGFCADGVCCNEACTASCRTCNLTGSVGTCANIPAGMKDTTGSGCSSTAVSCDGMGMCKKEKGQTCTLAAECASGFCTDGYCCDTACATPCKQCNKSGVQGTCSDMLAGTKDTMPAAACDGVKSCDGMGMCKLDNGEICTGGATFCLSGFCADGLCCDTACMGLCRSCNGSTPGTCKTQTSGTDPEAECGAYSCNGSGGCYTYCYSDMPYCSVSSYCNTSIDLCVTRKINGDTCSGPGQCISGFCVDGVCCNEACTGTCRACNVAPAGTCTFVPAGTDPALECAVTCDAPACSAQSGMCDGTGACEAAASCGVFTCAALAGCNTSCTSNTQCCGGRACAESSMPAPVCGGSLMGQSTSYANSNFTFSGLCTLEAGSDSVATSWGGYEAVYKFTAPSSQTVQFTMHPVSPSFGENLDLFVFVAEACSAGMSCCTTVTSCEASAHVTNTTDEMVSYDVTAGTTYYIVVDSSTTYTSTFDLSISCL